MRNKLREDEWTARLRAHVANPPAYRAPATAWPRVQARIAHGDAVLLPTEDAPIPSHRFGRLATAAGLALLLVGGAAALIQTDPLGIWSAPETSVPDAAAPAPPLPNAPVPSVSLVVSPDDGQLTIVITRPDPALRVRVRITSTAELEMTATGLVANARFRTGPGSLTVMEGGAGELALTMPASTRAVSIRIDGRTVFVKNANEVRVLVPADTSGAEFIFSAGK